MSCGWKLNVQQFSLSCQESLYSSPGEHGFSRHRVTEPGVSWENRCFTVTIFVHFGKVLRSSRSVFTIRTGSCRAAELQHETIPVQRNVTLSSDQFSGEPLYPWQDPDMQAAMLNELRTVPEAGKQRCISCPHDSDDLIAESHILLRGFYHKMIQLAAWCFGGALINDQQAGGCVQDGATSRG